MHNASRRCYHWPHDWRTVSAGVRPVARRQPHQLPWSALQPNRSRRSSGGVPSVALTNQVGRRGRGGAGHAGGPVAAAAGHALVQPAAGRSAWHLACVGQQDLDEEHGSEANAFHRCGMTAESIGGPGRTLGERILRSAAMAKGRRWQKSIRRVVALSHRDAGQPQEFRSIALRGLVDGRDGRERLSIRACRGRDRQCRQQIFL
jgi:hypothetical protein